jgi:zinc transport system ATP-binding protein
MHCLSGGQIQRVLLARALLGEPDILVLDEPAQNLDLTGQVSFYKMLEDIYKEADISILMISHDLHFVMKSSTRVICLFRHICCSGSVKEVSSHKEFIDIFGQDVSDIMTRYSHKHNHSHK